MSCARPQRDENGMVTVWVLGLLVIILPLVGIAIDCWRVIAADSALSSAVDAAAVAGANGVDEAAYRDRGVDVLDPARAEAIAHDVFAAQPEAVQVWDLSITADPGQITVSARLDVSFSIARMFHPNPVPVTASATATPPRRAL